MPFNNNFYGNPYSEFNPATRDVTNIENRYASLFNPMGTIDPVSSQTTVNPTGLQQSSNYPYESSYWQSSFYDNLLGKYQLGKYQAQSEPYVPQGLFERQRQKDIDRAGQSGMTPEQLRAQQQAMLAQQQQDVDFLGQAQSIAPTTFSPIDIERGRDAATLGQAQSIAPRMLDPISSTPSPGVVEQDVMSGAYTKEEMDELMWQNQRGDFADFLSSPAAYTDVDLNTSLFMAGQSAAFDIGDYDFQNLSAEKAAKRGNLMRGIGAAGKSLLNIGRVVGAGMGYQNRLQNFYEGLQEDKRQALVGQYRFEDGGTVTDRNLLQYFKNGGTVEKLSLEEAMVGEKTTGLPEHAQGKANPEVEAKEYITHPNGDVQKVVGNTHKNGGEKMDLESGTQVISKNLKLTKGVVKELKEKFDIDVKVSDTYAQAVDKFTKKIGLTKLNSRQEELFKKLTKIEEGTDASSLDLNRDFLSGKIKDVEDEKKELERQRTQFTDFLFSKQEESKGVEGSTNMFNNGGLIRNPQFQALMQKYNLTEQQALEVVSQTQNQGTIQQFDLGGLYTQPTYGTEAIASTLTAWENRPTYGYGQLDEMRNRIKQFATEYGEDIPTDIDTYDTDRLNRFAGQLQNKVDDEIAVDYGKQVPPTRQGVQWLLDNKVLKADDPSLKGIVEGGKVLSGSFRNLTDEQRGQIVEKVGELNESKASDYAKANFRDQQWYFRYPSKNTVHFKDKEKFEQFKEANKEVGKGLFFSGKEGKYIKPILLQEKLLDSPKELEEYRTKFGANTEAQHPEFLSEGESDVFYYPTTSSAKDVGVKEDKKKPEVDPTAGIRDFQQNQVKKGLQMPFLPDQSTLPPDPLQPHVKIERRFEELDPVEISPEESMKEIFRSQDFVAQQLSQLPDSQRRASLANLAANTQENINKAITTTAVQNAANRQQTEEFNIQQSNLAENTRAVDTLNFEKRQLTALGKTQADLANFFDFNRKVRLGNFNTMMKFNLLNSLYENYDVSPFGGVEFDPTQSNEYYVNNFNITKEQAEIASKQQKAQNNSQE